jgi:hypothetical protein
MTHFSISFGFSVLPVSSSYMVNGYGQSFKDKEYCIPCDKKLG